MLIERQTLNDFLALPLPREEEFSDSTRFAILSKLTVDGIKTHSEAPLTSNPSVHSNEFLGKTPEEIYEVFTTSIRPPNNKRSFWASSTFVILDERTREGQSVAIFTDHHGVLESVRTDFETSLWHAFPLEMMTLMADEIAWMDNAIGAEEGDVLSKRAAKSEDEYVEFFVRWMRGQGPEPIMDGLRRDAEDVENKSEEE